ncbi:MAG: hypothetical protein ACYC96_09645 [Fimbriimonadaceae bacterium]
MPTGLLLLAFMTSPPVQGRIDFVSDAAAVGPLLARLSAQTGVRLKAGPDLANEILFVRVKGVALNDLEARIADALAARWTTEGRFKLLTRTPADAQAIWNAHVAYRRKLVDVALKAAATRAQTKFDARALAAGLAAAGPSGNDPESMRRRYTQQQALFAQGPLARLLDRLVLACNPNDLAGVGPFERRIFSTDPTRMQRPIDREKYDAAIATFAGEQQAWKDAADRVNFSQNRMMRTASDPRVQLDVDPAVGPVSLEVTRGEMSALFMVNLASENMKPFGYRILTQTIYADPGRSFLDDQVVPTPPAKADPLVELSAASQAFQKRVTETFAGGAAGTLEPTLRDLMLDVTHNDPLSWTLSDILSTYAKTRNTNVVAALPDGALEIAMFVGMQGPMHVGAAMSALQKSGVLNVRQDNGWATITPSDRYEAALDFTPRPAVDDLMKSVFAEGRLGMQSYARYAFESQRLDRGGIGEFFLAMFDRSLLGASDSTDWKSLQLYGSLSPDEQRALEAGGRLAYAVMSPAQQRIVERIVFGERLTREQGGSHEVRAVEPTTAFALGLPLTCGVTATAKSTPVIVAYSAGVDHKTRPARSVDPATLATIESSIVGNRSEMAAYGVVNLAGYAMGHEKVVRLRVEVAPGFSVESAITVPDYDADATPVKWEKLPAPYAKQIADAMAQIQAKKAARPIRTAPPSL